MERFKERDLPLRCVLRMQKKDSSADEYIKSCQPLWDKAAKEGKLRSGTVFTYDDQIFVYFECREVFDIYEYLPDIDKYVYSWPGQEKPRPFIPMVKVYQSSPMEEVRDWKRPKKVTPRLTISRMKLDTLQEYTFWHYLLQEERPGYNGRYLAIWDIEDWCVLYNEDEEIKEIDMDYAGKLDTDNAPVDDWTAYMIPHFYTWPDGKLYQNGVILVHAEEE